MLTQLLPKQYRTHITQLLVPVVLIFALLFSFISHGQHYDLTIDSTEQHCQLCQQYIDKVNNNVDVNYSVKSCYLTYSSCSFELTYHSNNSVTPPLRAPPVQFKYQVD